MKKEFIAFFVGLILFVLSFLAGGLFDSTGHQHAGRVCVFTALMLFGITMLVGLYSSHKNYGYIWTNVRRADVVSSFTELDKKYGRKGKGIWQYGVAIFGMCVVAVGISICGAVLLLKEVLK